MSMMELQNLIKNIIVSNGERITFDFNHVDIKDNVIEINKNDTYDNVNGTAGISIDRNGADPVTIMWDEQEGAFEFKQGGNLAKVKFSADSVAVPEGEEGWKDLISSLSASNSGNPETSPLWADPGNGMWCWEFADDKQNECYADFHLTHDIKVGSKMYPHIHWMPLSYSTGTVRWKFEYIYAKGHQQGESFLGSPTTFYVEMNSNGIKGEHMISESDDLQAFVAPEIDSIIRIRVTRDATHPNDTFYGSVGGLMIDLHYESDRDATPNKAPNFYGE